MCGPLDAFVSDLLDQLEREDGHRHHKNHHHDHHLEEGGGGEGGLADQQLVEDAPKGPEVGGVVVRLLLYQLRGHVERGALGASWLFQIIQKNLTLMEVRTKVLRPRFLAKPKSQSLARPSLSSRMFCGLMSLEI